MTSFGFVFSFVALGTILGVGIVDPTHWPVWAGMVLMLACAIGLFWRDMTSPTTDPYARRNRRPDADDE